MSEGPVTVTGTMAGGGLSTTPQARPDCEYLFDWAQRNIERTDIQMLWVALAASVVALFAILLNLGAIETSQFKIGDLTIAIKGFTVIRIFLIAACFTGFLTLIYLYFIQQRGLFCLEFLSEQKRYDKAVIVIDFGNWLQKNKSNESAATNLFGGLLFAIEFILIVVLPTGTLIYSFFR